MPANPKIERGFAGGKLVDTRPWHQSIASMSLWRRTRTIWTTCKTRSTSRRGWVTARSASRRSRSAWAATRRTVGCPGLRSPCATISSSSTRKRSSTSAQRSTSVRVRGISRVCCRLKLSARSYKIIFGCIVIAVKCWKNHSGSQTILSSRWSTRSASSSTTTTLHFASRQTNSRNPYSYRLHRDWTVLPSFIPTAIWRSVLASTCPLCVLGWMATTQKCIATTTSSTTSKEQSSADSLCRYRWLYTTVCPLYTTMSGSSISARPRDWALKSITLLGIWIKNFPTLPAMTAIHCTFDGCIILLNSV